MTKPKAAKQVSGAISKTETTARTIGLVLKPDAPEALEALSTIADLLPWADLLVEASGHHAITLLPTRVKRVDAKTFQSQVELVVVLGGDGTFIHALSLLPDRAVPVLGINLGTIGFLTEVALDELTSGLGAALGGRLTASERMRLDVKMIRDNEVFLNGRIINDAVFAAVKMARIATCAVYCNDELVTMIRGDGVIVATPTGSTAYSLAAGGPILTPNIEAIAITPISPHQLSQRPLVVTADTEIMLQAQAADTLYATLDGQTGHTLAEGDKMLISRSPVPALVLEAPWRSYFEMLRAKLDWGYWR